MLLITQVAKWMLSKGQGATMGTYDTLLLAFDMDKRVDEAESLWNMILHTHTRSISKRVFSRMISLYEHHDLQDKIIEVLEMGSPHVLLNLAIFQFSLHTLSNDLMLQFLLSWHRYLQTWKNWV